VKARRFKSFLVAVGDVEHPPRALLTKSARLAQRYEARLELLHVIAVPYVVPAGSGDADAARDAEVERQRRKLERAAARVRKLGVEVECSVVWDFPAADAIVRHALKTKPDVVLAESHRHSKLARWFVTHTDWELIRSCPFPLWLVKTPRLPNDTRVLTAIDPFHSNSKPAALDEEILRIATVAAGDHGRVGAGHVYATPVSLLSGGLGDAIWVEASPKDQKRIRQRASQAMHDIADRFDIAKTDQIVEPGDPASELPEMVKRWQANLLVMGAVSRTGMKRAVIGHTAERIIDAARCDVLVVKPRSFKTPVNPRPNAAAIPVPPI
jgi:universal stress protein E